MIWWCRIWDKTLMLALIQFYSFDKMRVFPFYGILQLQQVQQLQKQLPQLSSQQIQKMLQDAHLWYLGEIGIAEQTHLES